MKTQAAVLYESGKPRPYAVTTPLVVEDLELEAPGTGEVLVELAGAGLCHSDLSTIDGSRPRPLPMVLGHEASGVVRETGPGVVGLKADDHVVFSFVPTCGRCRPCVDGRPALCEPGAAANLAGTLLGGGVRFRKGGTRVLHHLGVSAFSRYTVAAQESLIKIDPTFPLPTAALFGCAILTGVGAVVNTARVAPGRAVAVFGMGGVGLSAVMGAKLVGASPIIAVDVLPDKLDMALKLGAHHVFSPTAGDPAAAITDLTDGGVDFAFEAVGSASVLATAYASLRRGGTVVSIGLPHPEQKFSISAVTLVAQEKAVVGSYMGSSVPRRDVPRMMSLAVGGLLPATSLLSPPVRLEEINVGFDLLAEGRAIRQLVLFDESPHLPESCVSR
ncbi:zinc-dependent alcohol dehydrogenase family protein [Paludisphaera rhizosphaerae]|uniref:zinc-dependent alcohol dehydrogenase family protein n=1 Tax=Paludisphaera rhizosphaerae TaxID=2711216 RepID=UPI0013EA1C9F|nr:zinc-dependent alcohol dehydrogenase family protein [Paludisphaera rhizosphaerae]